MPYQNIFKRYEIKYLITERDAQFVLSAAGQNLTADPHGRSTLFSLYFDTDNHRLIRRSIEGPVYKEKLRLRSYGVATPESTVFAELKKKYNSVVYKRRLPMTEREAAAKFIDRTEPIADATDFRPFAETQVLREIEYAFRVYGGLHPSVLLSYDRTAYYAAGDSDFRVTFDREILWRDHDLSLTSGVGGDAVLPAGTVLMELKCGGAIPLWMCGILKDLGIYKTSFSKYGEAWKYICLGKGGQRDA